MNLPEWLKLSATSGTGSGTIKATADPCTARSAKRTTSFSVKTDSGSSRQVKVIQNGIPEFVTLNTGDISGIPATSEGTLTVNGISNSAILTVTTNGTMKLTASSYSVTDVAGNAIPFVSGSPIDGDPGASAQYSFTLIFSYGQNNTTNEVVSNITVVAQSGASQSIKIIQDAGESTDVIYPSFTTSGARTIPATAPIVINPQVAVYDPQSIGWDILIVADGGNSWVSMTRGITENYITPIDFLVQDNPNTENPRRFVMYLVPQGSTSTSITYASIEVTQLAAPVNPYIEGGEAMTSYANGLVTLRVVDQKSVGWYPQAIFSDNEGTVLISGTSDAGRQYVDTESSVIFNQETGATKMVGDGTVKVHINAADVTGDTATLNLRVSSLDVTTDPYDYVTITITNIPQFDVDSYEIVIAPNMRNYEDTGLTIGNPNAVPFIITTSNNPVSQRKATIYAGDKMIYDDSESVAPSVLTSGSLALSINAEERGQFNIAIKSDDGQTVFDTITVKVYRQPVLKFTEEHTAANPAIVRVTEPYTNLAKAYAHYGSYTQGMYDDADLLSNAAITYSIVEGETQAVIFNGSTLRGLQVLPPATYNMLVVRATVAASETDFYKEAQAEYYVEIIHTKAYLSIAGFEQGTEKINLYLPPNDAKGMPDRKQIQYQIFVDRYTARDQYERVLLNTVFPEDIVTPTFQINQDSQEPIIYDNGNGYVPSDNVIRAKVVPADPNNLAIINPTMPTTLHFRDGGLINTGSEFFLVEVLANTDFVLDVQGAFISEDGTYHYLYDEENIAPSGGTLAYPKQLEIKLKNGTEGNYVNMQHTLVFYPQNYTEPISTESGNYVIYDDDFLVKRNSSDTNPISTPSLTHYVDVALKSKATAGSSNRTLAIRAYVDGSPVGNVFRIGMWQQGSEANYMYFDFGSQEIEDWYDQAQQSEYGVPTLSPAQGQDLAFDIKLTSTNINEVLSGRDVRVERYVYDETYSGETSPWRPATDSCWIALDIGQYECAYATPGSLTASYTTGADGLPSTDGVNQPMKLRWNANSDTENTRRAKFVFRCMISGAEVTPSEYEFLQLNNADRVEVRWVRKDGAVLSNGAVRSLETNFEDTEDTAYTAKCYIVNSSGDTLVSPTAIEYTSTNENIAVASTGYVTIGNTNTGAEIQARVTYNNQLYIIAYNIQVVATKQDASIVIVSAPTASYEDALNETILKYEAYSTSGSEVAITATSGSTKIIPGESYTYEGQQGDANGKTITAYQFKIKTASSPNEEIAGTNAVTFRFAAPETSAFKPAETTQSLSIEKADDGITNWDTHGAGFTVGIGDSETKYYKLATRSGVGPTGMNSTSSTSSNGTLTWRSGAPFGYFVKGVQNGSFVVEATLSNNNANFKRPAVKPSNTFTISGTPVINRQLKLTLNGAQATQLSLAVGEQKTLVPTITYSSNEGTVPSSKPTPSYTVRNVFSENVSAVVSNGNLIVTGVSTTSSGRDVILELAQQTYGGKMWGSSNATVLISVGKASNAIHFSRDSITLTEGAYTEVSVTADHGTPVLSVPSSYNGKFTCEFVSGDRWRVSGISAVTNANLHASVTETNEYAGAGADLPVTVNSSDTPTPTTPDCAIYFNATYPSFSQGTICEINGTGLTPPTGATVSYSSNSNSVEIFSMSGATVYLKGVNPTQTNAVTITVTVSATGYNTYTTSFKTGVSAAVIEQDSVTISGGGGEIYVQNTSGYTYQKTLSAYSNHNLPISWSSSDNSIATVVGGQNNTAVVTGVSQGSVTITASSTGTSYVNGGVGETNITVKTVPGSTPEPEPDPDNINFDHNIALQTVYVTEQYYNGATTTSGRKPVRYSSSDVSKVNVAGAKVTILGTCSNLTLTMTLGTNPTRTYTCSITATSSGSSKNAQTIDLDTNGKSISAKVGDVFYIYPSVALGSGSYIGNNTWVTWSSADYSNVDVNGGLVKALSVSSGSIVITASYPSDSSYEAANGMYSVQTTLEEPNLRWAYTDGIYYFTSGQSLASDFNVALSNSSGSISYSSSRTGIAAVDNSGHITFGSMVGDYADITATQQASGKYSSKTITYRIYVNAYAVHFFPNGQSSHTNTMNVSSGTATVAVFNVKYFDGGNYYPDTYSYESPNFAIESSNPAANVSNMIHSLTVAIPANRTGQVTTRDILVRSGNGALGTLTVSQPPVSTDPMYYQWAVTRSNNTDEDKNTEYALGSVWDFGNDSGSVVYGTAGTDEDYDASLRMSHASGTPVWIELQEYGYRKTGTVYIHYEVLVSADGSTWERTSSSNPWFRLYFGDGNSSSYVYGDGDIALSSDGKLYPHIAWLENNTGAYRYGKVQFYVLVGNDKKGLWEGTFTQRAKNS